MSRATPLEEGMYDDDEFRRELRGAMDRLLRAFSVTAVAVIVTLLLFALKAR